MGKVRNREGRRRWKLLPAGKASWKECCGLGGICCGVVWSRQLERVRGTDTGIIQSGAKGVYKRRLLGSH